MWSDGGQERQVRLLDCGVPTVSRRVSERRLSSYHMDVKKRDTRVVKVGISRVPQRRRRSGALQKSSFITETSSNVPVSGDTRGVSSHLEVSRSTE